MLRQRHMTRVRGSRLHVFLLLALNKEVAVLQMTLADVVPRLHYSHQRRISRGCAELNIVVSWVPF